MYRNYLERYLIDKMDKEIKDEKEEQNIKIQSFNNKNTKTKNNKEEKVKIKEKKTINKPIKIVLVVIVVVIALVLCHLIKNYAIMKKINKLSYDKSNSINFHIKRITTNEKTGYSYETDGYCLDNNYKSIVKRDNKTYTFIKVKYGGIAFTEDGINKTAKIYNSNSSGIGNYMHPADYAFEGQFKNGFNSAILIKFINGNKYFVITSSKLTTYDYGDDVNKAEIYINSKTGLADKIIETKKSGDVIRYEYQYEFDNVTDEEIQSPDISKYKFEQN